MTGLNWGVKACGIFLLWTTAAVALPAQTTAVTPAVTFTTLINFGATNGANPNLMSLVQGADGSFYGTTLDGGTDDPPNNDGTVFKITDGTLTTLYSFCAQPGCTDGSHPASGLVQAANGNFYGTTVYGGTNCSPNGCGTVFEITPAGVLTTLHNFDGIDGDNPYAALIQGVNGAFLGTTENGGAYGLGTIFSITPAGMLTTLDGFEGVDGAHPLAALVQAANGDLYGTTTQGGTDNFGTIFEITPSGVLTTLHSFDGTDGEEPEAALIQATDRNFYGTTYYGGASGDGTIFKMNAGGKLTTLHSFDGTDGYEPSAGLVQSANGTFYGTTTGFDEPSGYGTIFKINAHGKLTTLHSFDLTDGAYPFGGLLKAAHGILYGTTYQHGSNCCGTVFSLTIGLDRPVK